MTNGGRLGKEVVGFLFCSLLPPRVVRGEGRKKTTHPNITRGKRLSQVSKLMGGGH